MAIIIAICLLLLFGVLVEWIRKKEAKRRQALYERALKASKRARALQASRLHEAMTLPPGETDTPTPPAPPNPAA